MQTGQVSVWVPIVVGVIGLIGIVAGQLVNAWREDRRWTLEQQREELRWQREQDKDRISRDYEYEKYWIDRKVVVYAQLLQISAQWIKHAHDLSQLRGDHRLATSAFADNEQQFSQAVSQVQIFGSTELIAMLASLQQVQSAHFFSIVGQEPMQIHHRDEMQKQLQERYAAIRSQVRDELRIARPLVSRSVDEM